MAALTREQKQELCKELYLKTNKSQIEICSLVGCSTASYQKWKKAGKWESLKVTYTITKEMELRRLYIQIREINNSIEKREEGERFATTKEADILSKLAGAAKSLENETSTSDIIDVFIGFSKFLEKNSFNKVKEIVELQDAYIRYKLSN